MNRSLASLRILSPLLLAFSLLAQQSPPSPAPRQPQGQFTFKRYVNRVVLDVVVTDSQHSPVRGLTKEDFSIYEDDKLQQVLSFDVHSLDSPPGYFKKLPFLPPNTFVNIATEPERGPLYVLLLDLVDTEQDDQPYARQRLLKFIDSKPEGTRFALFVLSDSLHLVQGFTADRAQLHAVLDPSHPRPHVPRIFLFGQNYGEGDPIMILSVFKEIALYLDGLSGRKNIIWYSQQFPLDLFPHYGDPPDERQDVTETVDALTRGECSIYPVDVSGVSVFPPGQLTGAVPSAEPSNGLPPTNIAPGANQTTLNPPGAWANGTPPRIGAGGGPLIAQMAAAGLGSSPWQTENVEDEIADFTGGRAFYGRNDFEKMLEEATEDGSNYYTLTYSPSNSNYDGKLRNISVRLNIPNKELHLEYRRGYLATAPESPIMPVYERRKQEKLDQGLTLRPVGDSLSAYMQHGAPIARQVYFRAHVQIVSPPQLATPLQMANLVDQLTYFRVRQKKHPNKNLAPIKLQTYLIEYQIIGRYPNFEVAAGVYDGEGRLLNGDVEEASSGDRGPINPKAKFRYFRVQQEVEVPAGAAWIRLGARDVLTDHMGTMEIHLPLAPEPDGSTSNTR